MSSPVTRSAPFPTSCRACARPARSTSPAGRLDPAESLAVATHSPQGFGWGNAGRGATQLGLALLLRATDRDTALAHYVAFTWQVIARLPRTDFELPVAAVPRLAGLANASSTPTGLSAP